jgi:hypothetical protein
VLFIITQQVQPAFIMQDMASQHDWIISQHLASPEVQVTQTPSLVISHLHMPIVRLQQQTTMPFIMTQQLHMPPAIMEQRFCTTLHAVLSSQLQVIFMPPLHFSNFIVQRGTIIQLAVGIDVGAVIPLDPTPGIPMPGMPMTDRSIIIVLVMIRSPFWPTPGRPNCGRKSREPCHRRPWPVVASRKMLADRFC